MANVNLEVLQQALDHFVEQEEAADAEIQQSEEKIVELEARIVDCGERLKTVEHDRDRVMEIMQRYATKSTSKPQEPISKVSKPEIKSQAAGKPVASPSGRAQPIKEPPKTPPKGQSAPEKKPKEAPADDDDTVKNINDALRGLFR